MEQAASTKVLAEVTDRVQELRKELLAVQTKLDSATPMPWPAALQELMELAPSTDTADYVVSTTPVVWDEDALAEDLGIVKEEYELQDTKPRATTVQHEEAEQLGGHIKH